MKKAMSLLANVKLKIAGGAISQNDGWLLVDEIERISKELVETKAVLNDCLMSSGHQTILDQRAEIERLQDVVVDLRSHLDWSTTGEYRYTSTFE
jgi:hypothetical protein